MDACEWGVDAFEEVYPDGLDPADWTPDEQLRVMGTELRFCIGWAWRHDLVPQWSMHWVDLAGADLGWADIHGADLCEANLRWANLRGADLREADLSGADLRETILYGADLRRATLWGADLRGANLRWATLRGAESREADLCGADLRGACLRRADVRGARVDRLTIWPRGFDPMARCTGTEEVTREDHN